MTVRSSVKIRPKNIISRINKLTGPLPVKVFNNAVREFKKESVKIYKKNVPVDTGLMRNSTKVLKNEFKSVGRKKRTVFKVGPSVDYGSYVDQGVGPSPGMYVPTLGVRVKRGIHPGQNAQNFNEKSKEDVEAAAGMFFSIKFNVSIRRSMNAELNG